MSNPLKAELLRQQFSKIVSVLIGHHINEDKIYTDKTGWYYYIPKLGLKKNHPLIMSHYHGYLFMVIPTADWQELLSDKISVGDYINNSQWSYGWYYGGGSLLHGSFWQPLEKRGIHETLRIARYFEILGCRTSKRASGYTPDEERCKDCWVEHCPFSPFNKEDEKASWENETQEKDARKELFKLVEERISQQFGFEVEVIFLHGEKEGIWLFPGTMKDAVTVYLPQNVLVDLLYEPEKYDLSKLVNAWTVDVCAPWHYDGEKFIKTMHHPVEKGKESKMVAYDIWKTHCPGQISGWGLADPVHAKKQKEKKSFFERVFHSSAS